MKRKILIAIAVLAIIALASVVITLNLKADIAIWQSDLPWWAKFKLLTR